MHGLFCFLVQVQYIAGESVGQTLMEELLQGAGLDVLGRIVHVDFQVRLG